MRHPWTILLLALPSVGCGDDAGVATTDDSTTSSSSSSSGEASSGTTAASSGSESSSSTTEPLLCGSDAECPDPAVPFCEPLSGSCVACDQAEDPDKACAGLDPLRPLCVEGTCVACTAENPTVCAQQLLLCDAATSTCVPCTEHGQCGTGACELAVGTCFPPGLVVHVDGDDHELPSMASAALDTAVAYVPTGQRRVIIVHEFDDGRSYGPVVIDGDKTVALLAAEGEAPMVQGYGGNSGIRVEGVEAVVYMDGISIRGSGDVGLRVNGGQAWVDRSRIVQNSGGGVLAEAGAELLLRNCFVGSLGDVTGVEIDGASASVLYSTVTASTFGSTPALGCTTPLAVDVRNSIIVSQGGTSPDELDCAGASVSSTATEAEAGAFNIGWFDEFNAGDFSLTPSGAMTFADVALWSTGDPFTDIDGDPRPEVDASPDYAGADLP